MEGKQVCRAGWAGGAGEYGGFLSRKTPGRRGSPSRRVQFGAGTQEHTKAVRDPSPPTENTGTFFSSFPHFLPQIDSKCTTGQKTRRRPELRRCSRLLRPTIQTLLNTCMGIHVPCSALTATVSFLRSRDKITIISSRPLLNA